MADEYIKREDALSLKKPLPNQEGMVTLYRQYFIDPEAVEQLPAADVVEVIRCGQCKHSIMHKFPYNYEKVLACNDPHGVTIRAVKPMHFCSYGKRKDGDGE